MAEIYTIGSGTWRSIGNAPTDYVSLPFNAFLNEAHHWSKSFLRGEFINSFDFDTEQFGIVPPPHHFQEMDKYSLGCTKTGVLVSRAAVQSPRVRTKGAKKSLREILSALEDRVVTLEESVGDVKERIDDVDDRHNDGLRTLQGQFREFVLDTIGSSENKLAGK
ncbi:hypothetical protein Goshw_022396, partial [Gossypium schwendimanii]|nr:hypothetical protein [Gossypium schwendimanii]